MVQKTKFEFENKLVVKAFISKCNADQDRDLLSTVMRLQSPRGDSDAINDALPIETRFPVVVG